MFLSFVIWFLVYSWLLSFWFTTFTIPGFNSLAKRFWFVHTQLLRMFTSQSRLKCHHRELIFLLCDHRRDDGWWFDSQLTSQIFDVLFPPLLVVDVHQEFGIRPYPDGPRTVNVESVDLRLAFEPDRGLKNIIHAQKNITFGENNKKGIYKVQIQL